MRFVVAPFVGQDPCYVRRGGGFDQLRLLVWRGTGGQCYDEGVLAVEGGDEAGLVGVGDFFDVDAGGEGVGVGVGGGGGARDGCDGEGVRFEQG